MKKIFIQYYRSFIPDNRKTVGDADWASFEDMLRDCFQDLSYTFNKGICALSKAINPDVILSAHQTRLSDPKSHIFYKQMHLSNLFTIDTYGWGPQHSKMQTAPDYLTIDPQKAIAFGKKLNTNFNARGSSKQSQPPLNSVRTTPEDFILAPIQRPTDVMIKNNSPISVYHFIRSLSDWAEENKRNIVFKLHPGNYLDPEIIELAKKRSTGRKYVHLMEGNIHDLIEKSTGVVCINSGVGFEGLIHGKPVATFGRCDYQWVTFNADVQFIEEAINYIDTYLVNQRIKAYQFIYYYYHHHAYSILEEEHEENKKRLKSYLELALMKIVSETNLQDSN